MKQILFPFAMLVGSLLSAQNQPPVISNVQVQIAGAKTLTISYDLADAESDAITVSFRAAQKGAAALGFNTANATGDIGTAIVPGTGKEITWDFSAYATADTTKLRLMLVADDLQPFDIQPLVDQVDSARLFGDLTFIEGIRHRTTGATHLQETKDFLWFSFLDKGLETTEQEFAYGNYTAHNIMGRQPGTGASGDTYILGGHFDSVDDAPGADDNGSAVAGMMEAMRILSQYPTKKSIKYIGFDLEEAGLIGSKRYVQNGILSDENILGMIDFEMIGYYSEEPNSQEFPLGFNLLFPAAYAEVAAQEFKGNFITNVGKQGGSATLMQAYKSASTSFVPALRVVNVEAPATPPNDLSRSDHAPFWGANIPAIMLTDGAEFRNPYYHTPNDTLGTLDFTFMSKVVMGAVATLAQLAEVQHADSWWTDIDIASGTTNPSLECAVKISPNPAHGILKIEWPACASQITKLSLLDANGRTIHTAENIEKFQYLLDVSSFAKGSYFLKMEGKAGSKTEQIVVD
jgi:hypothetical protein